MEPFAIRSSGLVPSMDVAGPPRLYLIGGTMGVGKSAACQALKRLLPDSVCLDGDWCWDMHPFQVTQETKSMVMDNICHMLNNFLRCSAFRSVIFGWVLHEQAIWDELTARLDTAGWTVRRVALVCSQEALRVRIAGDVAAGSRAAEVLPRSLERLPQYAALDVERLDTTHLTPEQTAVALALGTDAAAVMNRWQLTAPEAVYVWRDRAVLYVTAPQGAAVWKWNRDVDALNNERRALEHLNGCCRVYAYEPGHLLTQRLGEPLRCESSFDRRMAAFAAAFRRIHVPCDGGFDTYLDWLTRARDSIRRISPGSALAQAGETALAIAQELFAADPRRVLLHGDLHHDNLLRTGSEYAVIDPKGVIGPPVFDVPRFVLNELDFGGAARIRRVILALSALLGYDQTVLAQLFYMEAVLSAIWRVEDGEPLDGALSVAEEIYQEMGNP